MSGDGIRIYLVDGVPQHLGYACEQGARSILLSYWYYQRVILGETLAKHFTEPYPQIFADSGAYSALTQGANISIEEYGQWIKDNADHIAYYANLDVIMDAETTWENQKIMEGRGLNPLPCFHVCEDFSWLERYIDQGYTYICLGVAGMGMRKAEVMRWLAKCFRMAEGTPDVRFHGFALTAWKVMKAFPWRSVDSSTWAGGFRFGRIPLFDPKRGVWHSVVLGDRSSAYRYGDVLRSYGVEPEIIALLPRKKPNRNLLAGLAALSYVKAEAWLRDFHGQGLDVHLATTFGFEQVQQVVKASEGIRLYLVEVQNDFADIKNAVK
jgi:hypothetical protein